MKSSNSVFKRARPAFGTILQIELDTDDSAIFEEAFAKAEELEQCFSKFRGTSDLSRLNSAPIAVEIEVPQAFAEVLSLALDLFTISGGGFNPYSSGSGHVQVRNEEGRWFAKKNEPCSLDLSGIAKGYAVDKICELITERRPHSSGVVNAGGDLRFINTAEREVMVRGTSSAAKLRRLYVTQDGVATSSFSESRGNPLSTTVYPLAPRADLDESCSVTVMASNCALADALTKAVWFGNTETTRTCVKDYKAQVLILDAEGNLREQYT